MGEPIFHRFPVKEAKSSRKILKLKTTLLKNDTQ